LNFRKTGHLKFKRLIIINVLILNSLDILLSA
jgi:hypothetical protein